MPDIVSVLGIPYAAAPFGANRFREPRPAPSWTGVRDCGGFGPVSPQSAELPGTPVWAPGDEDILTVNVWAPDSAGPGRGPLPVLVWVHGGAYTFGSSAEPNYDGTVLARAGLVVVTFNYRLGFEGFGHIPDADGDFPDNRGLLDQVAALRWVRENIAAFGGDPENVTVAGQSSGAASISCLMVMEQARGLFRRAIAHSVVSTCYSPDIAAATTRQIAAAAGCAATADGLLGTTPQALVRASDQVVADCRANPDDAGTRQYDPVLYAPVLDGDVLPVDPLTGVAAGAARDVDLLVCHTTEEYWLLDAVGSSAKVDSAERLAAFARDFRLPDGLVDGYRALLPDAPVLDVYLAIFGDLVFGEYTNRFAEQHARGGGRAFVSRFARRRLGPDGVVRAWHCADVPFAFGTLDNEDLSFLIGGPPNAADHVLSERMVRAWADFAASGDPGWPPLEHSTAPAPAGLVRVWNTDDGLPESQSQSQGQGQGQGQGQARARRELWSTVEFPLLRA